MENRKTIKHTQISRENEKEMHVLWLKQPAGCWLVVARVKPRPQTL